MLTNLAMAIGTGIISSVMFWYLLTHRLGPRLYWEIDLTPYETHSGRLRKVVLGNARRRSAFDLSVFIRLILPGLVREGNPEVWTLLSHRRPYLDPEGRVSYAIRPELLDAHVIEQYAPYLPADLLTRLRDRTSIDLQEVLQVTAGASLELVAMATDSVSGSRGVVRVVVELAGYDWSDEP